MKRERKMTKAELIKALSNYPDNGQVCFTLPGAKHYFWVDKVTPIPYMNRPCIESDDAVNYEDIIGMADACVTENEDFMGFKKAQALRDFLIEAEEIENES